MSAMSATNAPDHAELAKRVGEVERQLEEMRRASELLREQVARAQDERIEDLELALFVEDRLQRSSGRRRPFEELVNELGLGEALRDER